MLLSPPVTDAGLEVSGRERPASVEADDVSDRTYGFGEGGHDGRLVEAEIHRISMPHSRRPARDRLRDGSVTGHRSVSGTSGLALRVAQHGPQISGRLWR